LGAWNGPAHHHLAGMTVGGAAIVFVSLVR
jgi:hypothetical protein